MGHVSLVAVLSPLALLFLAAMGWSVYGIVRSVRTRQRLRMLHCAVLTACCAIVSIAVAFVLSVSAWLSHSEAMKARVPYYWLAAFTLGTVLPTVVLYLLDARQKKGSP